MGRLPLLADAGQENFKADKPVSKGYTAPFEGIGKPEPLKGNLAGFWSRRIDEEQRLVYTVEDSVVLIFSCRGHYDD